MYIEIHRNAYPLQKCSMSKLDAFHEAVKYYKFSIFTCPLSSRLYTTLAIPTLADLYYKKHKLVCEY